MAQERLPKHKIRDVLPLQAAGIEGARHRAAAELGQSHSPNASSFSPLDAKTALEWQPRGTERVLFCLSDARR